MIDRRRTEARDGDPAIAMDPAWRRLGRPRSVWGTIADASWGALQIAFHLALGPVLHGWRTPVGFVMSRQMLRTIKATRRRLAGRIATLSRATGSVR